MSNKKPKTTPKPKSKASVKKPAASKAAVKKPDNKLKALRAPKGGKAKKPAAALSSVEFIQQGHNSGVNPQLQEIFQNVELLEENKKAISKQIREFRAEAKEKHGVHASVFNHELKLRRMDNDVRVQFEEGHVGLKKALGYQFALPLIGSSDEEPEFEGDDNEDKFDPEAAANEEAGDFIRDLEEVDPAQDDE